MGEVPQSRGAATTIVVTGASSGIGRATAIALANRGYLVFAGVRSDDAGTELRAAAGRRLIPLHIDVTDAASIAAAAREVDRAVGDEGIAGLVNNAGYGISGPIEVLPLDAFRAQYEVNVFGQIAVTQAFLPLLRRGTGRLVNIGSVGDRLTVPFGAPLASSKWAFASITEGLRMELRPWRIHVVLIEPATIHTKSTDKVAADAKRTLDRLDPEQRERYGDAYRSMIAHTAARELEGSSPDKVAAVILRAFRARRPRTRYLVGKDSHRLAFLAGWAPDRLLDWIRIRLFGLPRRFGDLRSPEAAPRSLSDSRF